MKIVFDKRLRDYSCVSQMIAKQKLTLVTDEQHEQLHRAERRGQILFATINPYQAEMGFNEPVPPRELLLADSQEELDATFYQLRAEI